MRNLSRVFSLSIATVALLLALVVFAGASAPSARANTVYTYTQTPFTTCYGTYVATCSSITLSGTLDLSLSLSQLENRSIDTPLSALDIVSFSFSDGFAASLSQLNTAYSLINIATNSQGQITDWYVMLVSAIPAAGTIGDETLIYIIGGVGENSGGFSGNDVEFNCTKATAPPKDCKTTVGSGDLIDGGDELGSGGWSLPETVTTGTTPEPSSLLLLGTGLLGLGPFIRRRT